MSAAPPTARASAASASNTVDGPSATRTTAPSATTAALLAGATLECHPVFEAGTLSAALDLFEERTGFIAARGLPIERFRFQGGFARNLDYYTGFIFEVTDASGGPALVGGGRYDGMLQQLGSPEPVPAIGCAFWLARCAKV